uniref:Secreted protein n=1 Tax=Oryza glumipatula TaxID=40148 RepID=A0A0D9ZX18_9ORYZ
MEVAEAAWLLALALPCGDSFCGVDGVRLRRRPAATSGVARRQAGKAKRERAARSGVAAWAQARCAGRRTAGVEQPPAAAAPKSRLAVFENTKLTSWHGFS